MCGHFDMCLTLTQHKQLGWVVNIQLNTEKEKNFLVNCSSETIQFVISC